MIDLSSINLSSSFLPAVLFILGMIAGDNVFVFFGFLFSQGERNLAVPALFLFLGIVSADYIYYWIGKSKFFMKAKRTRFFKRFFERVDGTIDLITREKINLAFFYCKFITGAKFFVDSYIGQRGVSNKKFISMTLLAAIIWSAFAFFVGYMTGIGFSWILKAFESITLGLLFIAIVIGLLLKVSKKAKRYFKKKYPGKSN